MISTQEIKEENEAGKQMRATFAYLQYLKFHERNISKTHLKRLIRFLSNFCLIFHLSYASNISIQNQTGVANMRQGPQVSLPRFFILALAILFAYFECIFFRLLLCIAYMQF